MFSLSSLLLALLITLVLGSCATWYFHNIRRRQDEAAGGIRALSAMRWREFSHFVLDAMRHPREIDNPLVNAYLARRALDYLVGFTLSPVLWRKLPGARSAGLRVWPRSGPCSTRASARSRRTPPSCWCRVRPLMPA